MTTIEWIVCLSLAYMVVALGIGSVVGHRLRRNQPPEPPKPFNRAREIDPDNPPTYLTLVEGTGAPATYCTCHQDPQQDGDLVLYWPRTPEILCARAFRGLPVPGPVDADNA